jgi:hypothetical protein
MLEVELQISVSRTAVFIKMVFNLTMALTQVEKQRPTTLLFPDRYRANFLRWDLQYSNISSFPGHKETA